MKRWNKQMIFQFNNT